MKYNKDVIHKIYEHALKEYPFECCGIVTGDDQHQYVHECENIQNRLNLEDPERYPRDARTAYFIERGEFDQIIASASGRGEKIIAFYHSHCDHEAYFSEEDFAAQTVFGEPEFPDAVHIVVSVFKKQLTGIKYYKWERDLRNFITLEV